MAGTLFWPLFQREHRVSRSPRCHRMPAHHGWARLRAVGRRTQHGHRHLGIRQGPRQWWDSPDLINHCKTTLPLPLHEVLCQCWQEGAVPQDTRDSKIITLYNNKGERNDCNNYRGISLSAKYLLGSYWCASKSWRSVSTRSRNVASVLDGQQ